jgi:hypothetical protein
MGIVCNLAINSISKGMKIRNTSTWMCKLTEMPKFAYVKRELQCEPAEG